MQKLRLFVVLEQLGPVRSFQWDPRQPRLAICSGGSKVYLWSPAGCVSVQVPGEGEQAPGARGSELWREAQPGCGGLFWAPAGSLPRPCSTGSGLLSLGPGLPL